MHKFGKMFFAFIFMQTFMFGMMEYQIIKTNQQFKELALQPKVIQSDSLLNDRIANYILKVNPKISKDSAYLIGDITIAECKGDLQKISVALAIFHTETRFKHSSVSEKGAGGIGQTMPVAFDEYKLRTKDSTLNPKTLKGNIKLSIWTLDNIKTRYVKRNYPDGIYATYNGGLKQLNNLKQGKPLAEETLNYIYSVKARQPKILEMLKV